VCLDLREQDETNSTLSESAGLRRLFQRHTATDGQRRVRWRLLNAAVSLSAADMREPRKTVCPQGRNGERNGTSETAINGASVTFRLEGVDQQARVRSKSRRPESAGGPDERWRERRTTAEKETGLPEATTTPKFSSPQRMADRHKSTALFGYFNRGRGRMDCAGVNCQGMFLGS